MSSGPARHRGRRAGRVPIWIPVLLLAAVGGWLFAGLEGDLSQAGFTTIDPRCTRIDASDEFVDERWREALSARLALVPEFPAADAAGVEQIRSALATLPFVGEIGEGRVLWPDGFEIAVRFREPVACIPAGDGYLAVSADRVVLPGEWTRPPRIGHGWLPVLGPLEDAAAAAAMAGRRRPRPGDRLTERSRCDALAVAVSMRAALAAEDFETMGAPLIDATCASSASVEEPGVVLHLEGGRRVYFGRVPGSGEPGELPEAAKWAALARGLKALRPTSADARDWSLLDVRWDVPDVLWRDGSEGTAEASSPGSSAPARPPGG